MFAFFFFVAYVPSYVTAVTRDVCMHTSRVLILVSRRLLEEEEGLLRRSWKPRVALPWVWLGSFDPPPPNDAVFVVLQGTFWFGDTTSYTGGWVDGLKHGQVRLRHEASFVHLFVVGVGVGVEVEVLLLLRCCLALDVAALG